MAQNIYDNPAFFEDYAQLPRSVQRWTARQSSARAQTRRQHGFFEGTPHLHLRRP